VARQNGIYVSKVYPGALDILDLTKGAIPLQADDAILDAIKQLWIWSNWGSEKNLYVRYGAKFGDSFIKVLDDRERRKVRFEVLDPRYVKYKETDDVGNITKLIIEYEKVDTSKVKINPRQGVFNDNQTYTYTEIHEKDQIQVLKNGDPFEDYHEDAPDGKWENIYGFVPIVHAQHMNVGLDYGATAYNEFTAKIDEINDAASLTNDQIRKAINVIFYYAGVNGPEELDVTQETKDTIPAIYGPAGSQPYPMIADLNIEHSLTNINQMLSELEADMPELALHRMRQQLGTLSGVAIDSLYDDAASRITEAQSNYDSPQIRAMQMGVTIGAINGYEGFQSFSADSYDAGKLEIMIKPRPPLRDTLSKSERMNYLLQSGAPSPAIWEELGYADKVDEWNSYIENSPIIQEATVSAQIEAANA
jgi:hypothetical protein